MAHMPPTSCQPRLLNHKQRITPSRWFSHLARCPGKRHTRTTACRSHPAHTHRPCLLDTHQRASAHTYQPNLLQAFSSLASPCGHASCAAAPTPPHPTPLCTAENAGHSLLHPTTKLPSRTEPLLEILKDPLQRMERPRKPRSAREGLFQGRPLLLPPSAAWPRGADWGAACEEPCVGRGGAAQPVSMVM